MSLDPLDSEKPVFTAADLVAYQRARGLLPVIQPPHSVLLAFQPALIDDAIRRHPYKHVKIFNTDLYLFKSAGNKVGLVGGFGSGSSATAAVVDQFIALGVQRFISIGLAGGLQENLSAGSIILATGAIRGEGVSRHYLPPAEVVESSAEILDKVSGILLRRNLLYSKGLAWTTDAPFRELRGDVLEYQRRGVLAVDMEAAGVLAVAKSYGLSAIAAFSIADMLADGLWSMPADLRLAQSNLGLLFDAAYEAVAGAE